MAVGAHKVALLNLDPGHPGATTADEAADIVDFFGTRTVVERHGADMECAPAVHAWVRFELAEPVNKTLLLRASLRDADVTSARVIRGIPAPSTFLAPPLVTVSAAMELGHRLLVETHGAAPEGSVERVGLHDHPS